MNDNDDYSLSSVRGEAEVDADEAQQGYNAGIFCRAIRFKGGEEIVCGVGADDLDWTIKKFVFLHQPMVFDVFGKLKPWSSIADQYVFETSTDLIRTMYEIKNTVIEQWNKASVDQHAEFLRAQLLEPDLSDEDREEIELELLNMDDGSEEQEESPSLYNHMPISKTIH